MLLAAPIIGIALGLTSWRAPWPRVWASQDGTYALAVIPGKYQGNGQQPTKLHLFTHDAEARQLTMWRSQIDFYPSQVLMSSDGRVVMLNEYPGYSDRTAVAIFSDEGKIIGRYKRKDLMSDAEFARIPGDEGLLPKRWIEHATMQNVRSLVRPPKIAAQPKVRTIGQLKNLGNEWPEALEIRTTTGSVYWFDLLTGKRV